MGEIGYAGEAGGKTGVGQAVRGKVVQHHSHAQLDTAIGHRRALVKD